MGGQDGIHDHMPERGDIINKIDGTDIGTLHPNTILELLRHANIIGMITNTACRFGNNDDEHQPTTLPQEGQGKKQDDEQKHNDTGTPRELRHYFLMENLNKLPGEGIPLYRSMNLQDEDLEYEVTWCRKLVAEDRGNDWLEVKKDSFIRNNFQGVRVPEEK